MKISRLGSALSGLAPLRTRDSQREKSSSGNQQHSDKDNTEDGSTDDSGESKQGFDEKELRAAIESFGREPIGQSSGLHAEADGEGPGLRVLLKDVTGATIRQMTGDEFVKLREATRIEHNGRGHLLDQKF
jgi:hypothetical protein